ncbi:hypothetical protein YYG_01767 [Plasmodium vinckei petteri]|uniref:Uncharacterized protein n=1 Tax=Plasmodium vinckei petteri TaxID=138298 RepID=W7AH76_PLAVN|nr:hypothetical protein YYG_01767 [Plasmodium vinckei petteri]
MNLTIKIINFIFYYLIIEPCLFSEYLGTIKRPVVFATLATEDIPNGMKKKIEILILDIQRIMGVSFIGPVGLPFEKKLNLGLRKYRYNIPDENLDNVMQSEMSEDAKELTDDIV